MADVRLTIAGRFYDVSTSDGQEQRLTDLAGLVDAKARTVVGTTEVRQLLFAALMLADEAHEASSGRQKADPASDTLREELAVAKAREETQQSALEEAHRKIEALETAAAEQAERLAAAETAAEAATKAAAAAPAKAGPAHGSALAALADRIEQLADKFEQLV